MTIVKGLHGRARMKRAAISRLRLLLLLLSAFATVALARLSEIGALEAVGNRGWAVAAQQFGQLRVLLLCAGPFLAGLLIDRYGPRRVVALAMIGWCGFTVLGAASLPPPAFALVGPLATDLLLTVVPVAALYSVRLAFPLRRRAVIVAALLIVLAVAQARPFTAYVLLVAACGGDHRTVVFLVATLGTLIITAWLLLFREADLGAGLDLRIRHAAPAASVLAHSSVWAVSLILLFRAVATILAEPYWSAILLREGALGPTVLVPVFGAAATTLAAAAWSDVLLRRSRFVSQARLPFIGLGFVALAIFAYASTLTHQNVLALAILDAVALGGIGLAGVFAVDLAPRALAGAFLGLVTSLQTVASFYVTPIFWTLALEGGSAKTGLILATGLIGAGLTLLLRRIAIAD